MKKRDTGMPEVTDDREDFLYCLNKSCEYPSPSRFPIGSRNSCPQCHRKLSTRSQADAWVAHDFIWIIWNGFLEHLVVESLPLSAKTICHFYCWEVLTFLEYLKESVEEKDCHELEERWNTILGSKAYSLTTTDKEKELCDLVFFKGGRMRLTDEKPLWAMCLPIE